MMQFKEYHWSNLNNGETYETSGHNMRILDSTNSLKNINMLFIASVGRSGSTTLRYLLNSLPKYFIDGENKNSMILIKALYATLDIAKNKSCYAYMNGLKDEEKNEYFRKIILKLLVGVEDKMKYNVVGFKEIRFNKSKELEFLLKIFPKSQFIMNYRLNVSSYRYSGFIRTYTKYNPLYLQKVEEKIKEFKKFQLLHPNITRTIIKENLSVETINELLMKDNFLKALPPYCRFTHIPHLNANSSCVPKVDVMKMNVTLHNCSISSK
ncbi:hypothetical protein SNEBB_010832 [Seison nebaliae]|nr:hypothetical protein SNEBB_010832 [Seison nebaliae]